MDNVVYRHSFSYGDNGYHIELESGEMIEGIPELKHITQKYPKILNISYGWDCSGTHKPPFVIKNSVNILYKIWKHIGKIDKGEYLIIARSPKILNVYTRRWLTNKNSITILESGKIRDTYSYVIVRKEK